MRDHLYDQTRGCLLGSSFPVSLRGEFTNWGRGVRLLGIASFGALGTMSVSGFAVGGVGCICAGVCASTDGLPPNASCEFRLRLRGTERLAVEAALELVR